MQRRRFKGADDLTMMQRLLTERTAAMGPGTNLHPGDVAHRIYSGLRRQRIDDVVIVWSEGDTVEAFALVWPNDQAFDVATRVGMDDRVLRQLVAELADLVEAQGRVETDVIGDDRRLLDVLSDLGFVWFEDAYGFAGQPIPAVVDVPDSEFLVRSVARDDAAALAEVHAGSFGSSWTPEQYEALMDTPGYVAENELVAMNTDGTLAGFTVTWCDSLNKVGHFEPLGVHEDHQRRGVGSLLLAEGMRRMQGAGMSHATVWHAHSDVRSSAFYAANGFERLSTVTRWQRVRSVG